MPPLGGVQKVVMAGSAFRLSGESDHQYNR